MNTWPKQSECIAKFGDPSKPDFGKRNLVQVSTPFPIVMGTAPIKRITINKICAESLTRILDAVWVKSGKDLSIINSWHANRFSGSFNVRPIRGSRQWSMHAFGLAIDWDASNNVLGASNTYFRLHPEFLAEFSKENWVQGGDWQARPDWMHVQAAIVA